MDNLLSALQEKWLQLKAELEELHRLRQKTGVEEATKKGIGLFIQFLCLSNNKPPCSPEDVPFADLALKPVNVKERLNFIFARPGLFPSYIQLCELMTEQQKLYAKKCSMKKASNQKG